MKLPKFITPEMRQRLIWIGAPAFLAALLVAFVAVPNYTRAHAMRIESRALAESTNQYLLQRSELDRLRRDVERMRYDREARGAAICEGPDSSGLVTAITRPVDGAQVSDQSIRIGDVSAVTTIPFGLALDRRALEVRTTGQFDAIFDVVRTAERSRGLGRIYSVELRRADIGDGSLESTIVIDEFFHGSQEAQP